MRWAVLSPYRGLFTVPEHVHYMTRNGFAVLRFDDRGYGAENAKELLDTATTLDFVNDVMAAVDLMASHPKVDKRKIGLVGHSEGGVIAPIVACERGDIAFVVMLAGFSYSLFAIIDISRVKKNKSKYTKKSIKKNEDTTISNVLEEFVA